MASSFSSIGEPINGRAFIEWSLNEQTVTSEMMTSEGLIEVKDAYILKAHHNLGQLTTKRFIDGIE